MKVSEKEINAEWPELEASLFSQLTYGYLTPLLMKGSRTPLCPEDLPKVSFTESTRRLVAKYRATQGRHDSEAAGWRVGSVSMRYTMKTIMLSTT